VHPRTPKRLAFLAETFRQVGGICWAATHLEYQLEISYAELTGAEDLDETQGERGSALVRRIKTVLNEGVVEDPDRVAELRDLMSRISGALALRDEIAHTTWLRTNHTKPGHITGQRYRGRGRSERDWHPDELEEIRERLEALQVELSTMAYNAIRPREEWI
jgi:hypothetical protein